MLSSINKYFSQNVMNIPFNVPFSMALGYYVDGTRGMMGMTALSVSDLVLKYAGFDSYYLSASSIGYLTGKKIAHNLISHYKCYKVDKDTASLIKDKIEILDHLLPVSISAMGIIAAHSMNKIEHIIVDYLNDNDSESLVKAENIFAENLEVG